MPGMGPPPKDPSTRQRRNSTPATTKLAGGRRGKCPPWPLPDDIVMQVNHRLATDKAKSLQTEIDECKVTRTLTRLKRELAQALREGAVLEAQLAAQRKAEIELWAELWKTPQAVMWEQLAWSREVAQYVRWKVRGEMGDLDAAKEARQWSDRLGLNPLALLRLRWEIERAEEAEDKGTRRRAATKPQPKKRGADPRAVLHAVS